MRLKLVRFLIIVCVIFIYVFCLDVSYSYQKLGNSNNDKNASNISESNLPSVGNKLIPEEKSEEVFARVKIPKININRKLYPIDSRQNTVEKNIQILKESNMPDETNGNFILAAHSGFSSIAYFHNLDKLNIGDEVTVNYLNNDYKYIISDKYDVLKTGKVSIKRDKSRSTITMITCKGEDKQLVVIGYLI
ncbi:MAG: sortase [Bacilli bacterium]|nr:sortase [Bacilli bacterium]